MSLDVPIQWRRAWCAWIATAALVGPVHAIEDIPEGGSRWVQGYDGNPPTPGFRVDGLLRIEAPDEPQPVGIHLESGRVEVGPTGRILVQHGPGGSRFFSGDLVNDGSILLNAVLLFHRDGAEWVNRGTVEAATHLGFGMTGKGAVFRQVSGEIRAADPSSRFEFYNQSRLIYEGGKVLALPRLVAATAEVRAEVTEELALRFLAQGSSFEGRFPEDLSITVSSDDAHGPAGLILRATTPIQGLVELSAASGSPGALIEMADEGITLGSRGVLRVKTGAGVSEIRGRLAVEGVLEVQGSARWTASGEGLTNRGRIRLPFGGRLQTTAPLVQTGGTLQIEGGELSPSQGLSLQGGVLIASGIVSGDLTNAALAVVDQEQPGRIRGKWNQTSAATLEVRVRETSADAEAALLVMGALNPAGTLRVVLGDGVRLTRGSVLRLVQAESIEGWFDRLVLPPLESGLHWQVFPSEHEVRLVVRDTPPTVLIEWIARDSGDRIRISGPWSTDTRVVLCVSHDLKVWTPIHRTGSFAGMTWFPIPEGQGSGTGVLTAYQAILVPAGSPD